MNRMEERVGACVFVALDFPDVRSAEPTLLAMTRYEAHPVGVKVGLELITSAGLEAVMRCIRFYGNFPVFVDLKFMDIPATVTGAVKSLKQHGPKLYNMHASGGVDMLRAGVAASKGWAEAFAVTVLTSLSDDDCLGTDDRPGIFGALATEKVCDFAQYAVEADCAGIVCSASDLLSLNNLGVGEGLLKLTPGIRPAWSCGKDDQSRVTTPAQAARMGADAIVVGRPITKPVDGFTVKSALAAVVEEFYSAKGD